MTVFLDRDGTINREVHHLRRVEDFEILEGAAQAIRMLNEAGMRVVVVTNQAAIGRGLLTEQGLEDIHAAMCSMLQEHGAHVDAIYSCPHHPTEGVGPYRIECACRKPNPGLLERAVRELQVDLGQSFVVGDKQSDLEAGRAAGCHTILVRTGYGRTTEEQITQANRTQSTITDTELRASTAEQPTGLQPPAQTTASLADHVADNLLEAAQWILARDI